MSKCTLGFARSLVAGPTQPVGPAVNLSGSDAQRVVFALGARGLCIVPYLCLRRSPTLLYVTSFYWRITYSRMGGKGLEARQITPENCLPVDLSCHVGEYR